MSGYRVFLDFEVHDLIRPIRGPRKREIVNFLRALEENPFLHGDLQTRRDGRDIEVKVFGKYSLLYWADHAVKEIKVVEFYALGKA